MKKLLLAALIAMVAIQAFGQVSSNRPTGDQPVSAVPPSGCRFGPLIHLTTTGAHYQCVKATNTYALIAGGGSGTVTSVGNGTIGPIFTASWATDTTTPALSLNFAAQSANCIVSGPVSGGAAVPTCRAMVAADLGSFALNASFKTITVQPVTDLVTATFRRSGAAQTSHFLDLQDEANNVISFFDAAGVFNGNVIGNLTGNVSYTANATGNAVTDTDGSFFGFAQGIGLIVADSNLSNSARFNTQAVVGTKTITLPNASGTLALTSSNVATATALAANPTDCSAGNFPLGVDASGNAENCTAAVPTSRTITAGTGLSGGGDLSADRTLSISITPANNGGAVALQATTPGTAQTGNANLSGTFIAGAFSGPLTGDVTGNASGTAGGLSGTALSGDVTNSGNAVTLATVNSNVGSFGSATAAPSFTVNAKGLITAAGSNTVTPAESSITFTDITTGDASTSKHGYLPKLTGSTSTFLRSDGTQAAVTGSNLTLTDVTTNDVSSSAHGFMPKLGADDTIPVSSGSAYVSKAIPDCTDTGGNHLNYTASTNSISCGTSGASAGANTALSNLASVSINADLLTGAGTAANLNATAPTAAASSTAGATASLKSSAATAGTTNAGAAAGGVVTIQSGAAARLTSGNANGGDIVMTTGAGIGTGLQGKIDATGVAQLALPPGSTTTPAVLIGVSGSGVALLAEGGNALTMTQGNGGARNMTLTTMAQMTSAGGVAFTNSSSATTSGFDTYMTRLEGGVMAFGTSGGGNASASIRAKYVEIVVGGNVASAATITPTGGMFHVTGTTQITTINLPRVGYTGCLQLLPDGAYTFATGGNIAIASTATVGRMQEVCYDGTSWFPSY